MLSHGLSLDFPRIFHVHSLISFILEIRSFLQSGVAEPGGKSARAAPSSKSKIQFLSRHSQRRRRNLSRHSLGEAGSSNRPKACRPIGQARTCRALQGWGAVRRLRINHQSSIQSSIFNLSPHAAASAADGLTIRRRLSAMAGQADELRWLMFDFEETCYTAIRSSGLRTPIAPTPFATCV